MHRYEEIQIEFKMMLFQSFGLQRATKLFLRSGSLVDQSKPCLHLAQLRSAVMIKQYNIDFELSPDYKLTTNQNNTKGCLIFNL